ncbi:MAG: lipid-binding SYLF domain-containing protein [Gammaproteobacteria bacterium]|nr:lipid-binding SYLF domain-containing protein [Gammaproteobacteria bacterium]TVQ50572.1 MAG: hypothetical protein EA371_00405 [Gammaproteobacteria bacterium]
MPGHTVHAADDTQSRRLGQATEVLEAFSAIPENAIPSALLERAHGVAVIPAVIKVGFVVGARRGRGVLVVRQEDGSWSNPVFITLTGGSLGWQVGGQSTDVVLVFKSSRSVEGITSGKFTLGVDAAAAAGPVGRQTAAATDITFGAEVYSYSRSRGLFLGVSLDGAAIQIDNEAARDFYRNDAITAEDILGDPALRSPTAAQGFLDKLTAMAPRSRPSPAPARRNDQPGVDPAAEVAEAEEEARIFPIDDF